MNQTRLRATTKRSGQLQAVVEGRKSPGRERNIPAKSNCIPQALHARDRRTKNRPRPNNEQDVLEHSGEGEDEAGGGADEPDGGEVEGEGEAGAASFHRGSVFAASHAREEIGRRRT